MDASANENASMENPEKADLPSSLEAETLIIGIERRKEVALLEQCLKC